jgi:hypothetical protein
MRKTAVLAVLGAMLLVVPANAHKPPKTDKPDKSASPHSCAAHSEGYNASGTLVTAGTSLTALGHGRYSGTIEVALTRVNHHAASGDQTFTLTNARVKFHHGVTASTLANGDRVGLHGKITEVPKHCSTTASTTTIKNVDVSPPKKAKA